MRDKAKTGIELLDQTLPQFFWIGEPSHYDPKRDDLKLFPPGDKGGRELLLPQSVTPQQLFDMTMPVLQAQAQELLRRNFGQPRFENFLVQGIIVNWIFASTALDAQAKKIAALADRLAKLEARLAKLEKTELLEPPSTES